MWRDRTNLFISYRQSYSHHPAKKPRYTGPSNAYSDNAAHASEERRGLMSQGAYDDDGDAVIEMDVLPPRWLDVQDEVTEQLADIAKQTRRLDQLHQKHVLPGFDDEDVKKREEREIERLTQDITRGFQTCQRAIKRIDVMLRDGTGGGGINKGEEVMARNLKISLASRVSDSSAIFRKKQSAYLKKLRTLGGLGSPAPGISRSSTPTAQNPYADPAMQESYEDTSLSRTTLQQTAQARAHTSRTSNDNMIAQREREIDEIAQGIIELASIFQELNSMVIDQGSMLDRIDYNVERMTTDVKEADKELTVATNYQRRTVKRKAMLLLVILIAGAFILLGLKLGSRGGGGNSPPPVVNPNPNPNPPPNSNPNPNPPPLPAAAAGANPPLPEQEMPPAVLRRSAPPAAKPHRKDWLHRRKRRIRQSRRGGGG